MVTATANGELAGTLPSLVEGAPDISRALALRGPLERAARSEARRWTIREGLAAVDEMTRGNALLRQFAIALLAGFGPNWGWSEDWTSRLAELRRDDDVGVRTEALELLVS